jgi:hypothetical protein
MHPMPSNGAQPSPLRAGARLAHRLRDVAAVGVAAFWGGGHGMKSELAAVARLYA